MKKYLIVGLVLLMSASFALAPQAAFADGGKGSAGQCEMAKKFFGKVKMIYMNQKELDVSDKQMEKIKKLKIDTKKYLIEQNAKIDLLKVDIKVHLWEPKVDTGKVNKLVDKKYDLKKDKVKYLVKSYASLKKILSDEQMDKLKDIYLASKKEKNKHKKCPLLSWKK